MPLKGLLIQATQQMKQNNSKYVAGDKPCAGDFCIASIWFDYAVNKMRSEEKKAPIKKDFEAFPKVLEMISSLRMKPGFNEYMRNRKKASF